MSGTDDRSPGSIEQLALSWGLSPEQARKVAATAVALAAGTHPLDDVVPAAQPAPRLPAQRRTSPTGHAGSAPADDGTAPSGKQ